MNKILYVAVDVDDQAFHGYAVACDEAEGADFIAKPSAAHWTQAHRSWLAGRLKELENPLVKLNFETLLGRIRLLEEQIYSHDGTLRTLALNPRAGSVLLLFRKSLTGRGSSRVLSTLAM